MKNKQVFDYREPFNAPAMIREIVKGLRLPFVVYTQDFIVAVVSFSLFFLVLYLFFGFNKVTLGLSVGGSYGCVQLFNRLEPDGKRVDIFLKEYCSYLVTFGLSNKKVYHEEIEKIEIEKVVYEKQLVEDVIVNLEED